MRILIMGPPGAGKGTQAQQLKIALKISHISTGNLLRIQINKKTDIGILAKQYIDKGKLVPDKILFDLVKNRIKEEDCDKGYLLDGFPRTINQAIGLEKIMSRLDQSLDIAISIFVNEKELIGRLVKRGAESGRSDDKPTVIRKRQKIYWEQTAPLLDFYRNKGLLKTINGLGQVKTVTDRIIKTII
tara:strand:+ start:316 stop:876 length:561 start_codon:yes stop_codon:yes gene_type:complete